MLDFLIESLQSRSDFVRLFVESLQSRSDFGRLFVESRQSRSDFGRLFAIFCETYIPLQVYININHCYSCIYVACISIIVVLAEAAANPVKKVSRVLVDGRWMTYRPEFDFDDGADDFIEYDDIDVDAVQKGLALHPDSAEAGEKLQQSVKERRGRSKKKKKQQKPSNSSSKSKSKSRKNKDASSPTDCWEAAADDC
jgi:hypothetical protein